MIKFRSVLAGLLILGSPAISKTEDMRPEAVDLDTIEQQQMTLYKGLDVTEQVKLQTVWFINLQIGEQLTQHLAMILERADMTCSRMVHEQDRLCMSEHCEQLRQQLQEVSMLVSLFRRLCEWSTGNQTGQPVA